LRVNAAANNRLIAPVDWCVLEVKTNDKVPDWVGSMLARYGCQLRRISKYCATIGKLSRLNVPDVELPSWSAAEQEDTLRGESEELETVRS
jgi:hypothetical protein